ncbi:MAG: hypothetical protein IT430_19250 [Phycisphaerales bacterium]|nr:hypothetical protein [Phycisphaerales bacterium]
MTVRDRIRWWEPIGASYRRSLVELCAVGILRPLFWIRVLGFSFVVIAGLIAWLVSMYPTIAIPWAQLITKALLGALLIFCACALVAVVPRRIEIGPDEIRILRGQSHARIILERIENVFIDDSASTPSHLVVLYRTRIETVETLSFAIKPTVDREALDSLVRQINSAVRSKLTHDSVLDGPPG